MQWFTSHIAAWICAFKMAGAQVKIGTVNPSLFWVCSFHSVQWGWRTAGPTERLKLLPAKTGLAYRPQKKYFPVAVLVVSKPGVQTMVPRPRPQKVKKDSCFREEDREGELTIKDIEQKNKQSPPLGPVLLKLPELPGAATISTPSDV